MERLVIPLESGRDIDTEGEYIASETTASGGTYRVFRSEHTETFFLLMWDSNGIFSFNTVCNRSLTAQDLFDFFGNQPEIFFMVENLNL